MLSGLTVVSAFFLPLLPLLFDNSESILLTCGENAI
jgi:hypothetical protein